MSYSEHPAPGAPPGPVAAGERIASLDLLRGVAILGILVMNIYAFAMPFAAYFDPYRMGGNEPWNIGTWVFTHIVFDQKFMTIFAMLFGAGMVLMMERAEARGARFGPIFFRRQFVLLLIGLAHLVFLWLGDILSYYALISMAMFFFRRWSPRRLLVLACLMLPVPLLLNYGTSFYMAELMQQSASIEERLDAGEEISADDERVLEEWRANRTFFAPTDEDTARDLEAHRGTWRDAVQYRVENSLPMLLYAVPFFMLWRVGGLMLIGMALMKLGILSAQRSTDFYRRLALLGYGLGLPLAAFSAWNFFAHDFDPVFNLRAGNTPNYVASILVALGHIAAVMLVARSGVLAGLVRRFKAVGRMALTNYLMHSIVMTTLFYGYGFGLYGSVPRLWQMLFVVALIGLQLLLSPWWLSKYRFGPAEWAWRSLTYGRRQPLRA